MILANGYIQFQSNSVGGIDHNTGLPKNGVDTYEPMLKCQIVPNNLYYLARVDEVHYNNNSYRVLTDFKPSRQRGKVRLLDSNLVVIGIYSISQIVELSAVRQWEIIVK